MKIIKTILLMEFACFSWHAEAQKKPTLQSRVQLMAKEQYPEKNVNAFHSIIKEFKLDTIKNAEEIDVLKGEVALSYLRAGIYPQFEKYIALIKNKFNQTSFLNTAAAKLFEDKIQMDYAEVLAKNTIECYESYKDDSLARPVEFPLEDWNRFMKMAAYPYYETYAAILHAVGKDKTALSYEEKALEGKNLENIMQSSIELYIELLASQGQERKAYDILLKMASVGKSSLNMNFQLKQLTIKKMGSEAKASVFLDSIQRNVANNYKNELMGKMIANVEAPDFNIFDVNGKQVSLSALKGKIVVLDFWATWCVPCIASMPAMKKVSSEHPDVVFLFIATQEQGKDAALRVKSYIKKNGFPFNTLMDKPSDQNPKIFPVVASYKINGIPAKVIIDGNGKVRFITEGFTSDSELIHELEAMVSIVKRNKT